VQSESYVNPRYKFSDVTGEIIRAFYDVYNQLGYGFLEKVYENALAHELRKRGLKVTKQIRIDVKYDNVVVGQYVADLLVADQVIVEVKAVKRLLKEHKAQLMNYLKATRKEIGLILNFGPIPEISRKVN